MRARRARARLLGLLLFVAGVAGLSSGGEARAQEERAPASGIPSFAELEAAGAVIGEVRIVTRNIFDLEDEKENNALFRLANTLHIVTRPQVIERRVLFKSGERVSQRLIDETERLLLSSSFLYEVEIVPVAYRDGVVDIEVRTRDTWSLQPGISFSRTGGANKRIASLREYNALGTGVYFGLARTTDPDRTGTEYRVTHNSAFGGWTTIDYALTRLSDGRREAFTLARPFYALDTRSAFGFAASKDTRVELQFAGGLLAGEVRHDRERAELYGGGSRGLVDGWARRYVVGLAYADDRFSAEPGRLPPAFMPEDTTYASPFVRVELVEDDFEKTRNRDLIARPEYFAMGFSSRAQLSRSLPALGSTRGVWSTSADVSNGFRVFGGNSLLASAALSGNFGDNEGIEERRAGGALRFYGRRHQNEHALFYASLSADRARVAGNADPLLLGGDNGMRGYPLRYQSGDRRVILTAEQRGYTDLYVFRLFRIGGAVFADVGRAWGGQSTNVAQPGWLSDVGFGLRILSARTAFGNVLHADIAFPLTTDPNIRSYQFSLEIKSSF